MRTLYESILDDDDVLFSNAKKDIKCPLLLLYHLYKQYKSFEKVSDEDIREIIISTGLPRAKYLVIKKYKDGFSLYDETIANKIQVPICTIFVGNLKRSLLEEIDSIFIDLEDRKSIINKFFGGRKKYEEFCKKMWGWEFVQPNYWRFYYKFE